MASYTAKTLAMLGATVSLCAGTWAQTSGGVSEEDVEPIKREQPVITDQDILRAQQKYRAPTDAELGRAPITSIPKIEALPQPQSRDPVDPQGVAKRFEAGGEAMQAARGTLAGPGLLVFASLGIPETTLQGLIEQAARAQAVLVLRGIEKESIRQTAAHVQRLIGRRQVSVQIDPQAFERYGIEKVPTFAVVRAGAQTQKCAEHACMARDSFASVAGDVSLDYALAYIQNQAPGFRKEAQVFLSRLGR